MSAVMPRPKPKKPEIVKVAPPRVQSTRGTRVVNFIEKYIIVPEGALVGKPMVLLPEQKDYIHSVYDNTSSDGLLVTRRGLFSAPRKQGKTGLCAALVAAHIIGPEAKTNSHTYSAARSRDQAAMVFNYLAKSMRMHPLLGPLVRIIDSNKRIVGQAVGAEYKALSADATTAHGLSPAMTVHDELGQVVGPVDALYDALETAGGAQTEALTHIISTQAASDTDLLSILIDDMRRNPTPENVLRLYAAETGSDIFDPVIWKQVNFALGIFRNEREFKEAADRAKRMPSFEATFRNLYLNQRVSLLQLLIAPSVWKDNAAKVDDALFTSGEPVHIGADLSQARDLTALVLSCKHPDTGIIHLRPFVFTPLTGLAERAQIDRAPYELWVRRKELFALPGRTISYNMIAQHMKPITDGMNIKKLHFDRWRIDVFRRACKDEGWLEDLAEDDWKAVGQGFRDMSPRIESFETLLLNERLAHGSHPVLNMAAANAVTVRDPANNRKLDKAKASAKIDPLVAAIMSAHGHVEEEADVRLIDDRSLFFV